LVTIHARPDRDPSDCWLGSKPASSVEVGQRQPEE
jgi:hypothetical protein